MAGGTFPTSVPSYTITAGAETANGAAGGRGLSGLLNDFEADVTALANKVGTGATVPAANTIPFGTGAGTSAWQGLTSAQLAAILSDETGSGGGGLAVFNQSPTIVTPTVASLTNMQHTHANAAGGGQLTASAFANNAITAALLATSAISLGSAATGGLYSSAATTATQLTGASVSVTWPAGGRAALLIFMATGAYTTGATGDIDFSIWDGTVGSGTRLQDGHSSGLPLSNPNTCMFFYSLTPAAGAKTYNIGVQVNGGGGGTANIQAGSTILALVT